MYITPITGGLVKAAHEVITLHLGPTKVVVWFKVATKGGCTTVHLHEV